MIFQRRTPPWYQDFSHNQAKHLTNLHKAIRKDYEKITAKNTQHALISIGIISPSFTISPKNIKKLHRVSNYNPIDFLRHVYKLLTGNYFEDEPSKIDYGCNERIILSSIAFLTFPETVIELHKRLPSIVMPKLPPKPDNCEQRKLTSVTEAWNKQRTMVRLNAINALHLLPLFFNTLNIQDSGLQDGSASISAFDSGECTTPPSVPRKRKCASPYEEKLFTQLNWATYRNDLRKWREKCAIIPIPKVILPSVKNYLLINYKRNTSADNVENVGKNAEAEISYQEIQNISTNERLRGGAAEAEENFNQKQHVDASIIKVYNEVEASKLEIPRLPDGNRIFDFTLPKLSQNVNDVKHDVKHQMCGIPKRPQQYMKSWLGEKEAHFIIAGISRSSPVCSITYEVTGIAKVTPCNSDEQFFTALNRKDSIKKIYPKGRKNLSRKWQEWLQNVDEEFTEIEMQMNNMLRSIEETMRSIVSKPVCDSCCSCKQTRKTQEKLRQTTSPHVMMETTALLADGTKIVVGSIVMHSPAPDLIESEEKIEVIPSQDMISMVPVIHSTVKDEKNETKYFLSEFQEYKIHLPSRIIKHEAHRSLKNVPPCNCHIQQMYNTQIFNTISNDSIPWTKDDELYCGKKYRPDELPVHSCSKYLGDKSCRSNSFKTKITQLKPKEDEERVENENVDPSCEKQMYSIADFQPCGDQHGMSLCGSPWGTLNIYTKDELEEEKRIAQEILKAPPCGQKPGRQVCGGSWGITVPEPERTIDNTEESKKGALAENIEDVEEDEEEENEKKKDEKVIKEVKKRPLYRDKACFANPDIVAIRQKKVMELKMKKFIPDFNYPAYDKPWNLRRTAPATKNNELTDYEKSLKLTPTNQQLTSFSSVSNSKKVLRKRSKKAHDKKFDNRTGNERLRGGSPSDVTSRTLKKYQAKTVLKVEVDNRKRKKRKKYLVEEKEEDTNAKRKYEMLRLKNMMFSAETYPYNVEPAIIPEDAPRKCQPPPENTLLDLHLQKPEDTVLEFPTQREPCGWKTKSQQELLTKKNIVYLVNPDYPMEMISVRKGGTPCLCRERRNKKKVLMYAISSFINGKNKSKRIVQPTYENKKEVDVERRVLEGVFYYTPPPSPRRSNEYIPEYELYESPYNGCKSKLKSVGTTKIESYLTPKSMRSKTNGLPASCTCISQYKSNERDYDKLQNEESGKEKAREVLIESKLPEERWALALKDVGLIDYFTGNKNSVPCWIKCQKFTESRSEKPLRKLQAKRPVCECMYERKILSQKEEEQEWNERQSYLKKFKKHAFHNIIDTSMPIELDKKLLINDVLRIPRDDEFIDDVKYSVCGVSENYVPASPQTVLAGINMSSPVITPEPSKLNIPLNHSHKHWSLTNISPEPLPTKLERNIDEVQVNSTSNSHCKISCIISEKTENVNPHNMEKAKKAAHIKLKNFNNIKSYSKIKKTQLRQRAGGDKEEVVDDKNKEPYMSKSIKKVSMGKLLRITKVELKAMAKEGFLFPKLPKCYLMPQLQIWLMYRNGFTMTDKIKRQLMRDSSKKWNQLSVAKHPRVDVPSLDLSEKEISSMTYSRINEMKQKVQEKKKEFFKDIQKERVSEAKVWWPTMKFVILPNRSFKNAYFTYMSSKETDGHVFKPWKPN